jgi:hypothetical protein
MRAGGVISVFRLVSEGSCLFAFLTSYSSSSSIFDLGGKSGSGSKKPQSIETTGDTAPA